MKILFLTCGGGTGLIYWRDKMSSYRNVITGWMHAVVRRLGLPSILKEEWVMLSECPFLVDLAMCWQGR